MRRASAKSGKVSAIRAVLKGRRAPIVIDDLIPLLEIRLKMVIGRQVLYTLLSVMMVDGQIKAEGRGRARAYSLIEGEAAK